MYRLTTLLLFSLICVNAQAFNSKAFPVSEPDLACMTIVHDKESGGKDDKKGDEKGEEEPDCE